jgi:hypothetical protein
MCIGCYQRADRAGEITGKRVYQPQAEKCVGSLKCPEEPHAKSLCKRHYQQWLKRNSPKTKATGSHMTILPDDGIVDWVAIQRALSGGGKLRQAEYDHLTAVKDRFVNPRSNVSGRIEGYAEAKKYCADQFLAQYLEAAA